MNTSTDAGQRALEALQPFADFAEALGYESEHDGLRVFYAPRDPSVVLRVGDFRKALAAFASPVTPAVATIPEGLWEGGIDRQAVMRAFHVAEDAPELNLSNYDHEDVAALNAAMIEVWQILGEAQAANAAVKSPIPPATIPGGEREGGGNLGLNWRFDIEAAPEGADLAIYRHDGGPIAWGYGVLAIGSKEDGEWYGADGDPITTPAAWAAIYKPLPQGTPAALTSTGEASDEVLADAGGADGQAANYTDRFWLVIREPGCVPNRKGPWMHSETAKVLREFMAANPTAFIDHLTIGDDGTPDVEHGPLVLQYTDGRSMSVGRKHNERVRAAALSANPVPVDAGGVAK